MKKFCKIISFIIAFALSISVMAVSAFAEEIGGNDREDTIIMRISPERRVHKTYDFHIPDLEYNNETDVNLVIDGVYSQADHYAVINNVSISFVGLESNMFTNSFPDYQGDHCSITVYYNGSWVFTLSCAMTTNGHITITSRSINVNYLVIVP